MARFIAAGLILAHLLPGHVAFIVPTVRTPGIMTGPSVRVGELSAAEYNNDGDSRRNFISQVVSAAAGLSIASFLPSMTEPAYAFGGKLDSINGQLKSYGLPPIKELPNGFTPLLELYGKGKSRSPLLVEFVHPVDWVVTLPNVDANGEEGTVQAGQYAKGDTATLYVLKDQGKVENIADQPKAFFQNAIIKALTQKGDNIYQNFKLTKLVPTKVETGKEYVYADFKYELLTGAGFTVDRTGTAAVTSEGDAVQVFWAASTAIRYKKTEEQLRTITKSFRCYADGLNLSSGLAPEDDF